LRSGRVLMVSAQCKMWKTMSQHEAARMPAHDAPLHARVPHLEGMRHFVPR
jgi:hypothetical protein